MTFRNGLTLHLITLHHERIDNSEGKLHILKKEYYPLSQKLCKNRDFFFNSFFKGVKTLFVELL